MVYDMNIGKEKFKIEKVGHIGIGKCIWIAVVFYLIYVLCTGTLQYWCSKSVSKTFASSVSTSDFYRDTICTDRVALVEYPGESFDARIHILDEAEERIDISYYAMHMGESTDLFLGTLLEAADSGVHIRILVDGQFGGLTSYHRAYATALGAHPNIELKTYNPPSILKPWTWNGRLHDKYIIIDDRLLLMGGRNIGDKYFAPEGYDKSLSYDRDVLLYNTAYSSDDADSVLFDVRDYMDSIWDSESVYEPFLKDTNRGVKKRQELQMVYEQFRLENPNLFNHMEDDYEAWTYPANCVTFFHNDMQTGPKEPKTGYILGQLLMDANESVVLQSPYIILDDKLEELLKDLGEKQIDARILTNSMGTSPNPVACTAYFGDRKTILKTGISLWEYQGINSIHAKTYLIDDRMAVVGSYNLDPRSAYIDTEMMLAIDSADFAQHLKQVQAEYLSDSLMVDADGNYLPNQSTKAIETPVLKKIMFFVLFPLVQFFKYLT